MDSFNIDIDQDTVDINAACKILDVKPSWLYDHTSRAEPFVPHFMYDGMKFSRKELEQFKASTKVNSLAEKKRLMR